MLFPDFSLLFPPKTHSKLSARSSPLTFNNYLGHSGLCLLPLFDAALPLLPETVEHVSLEKREKNREFISGGSKWVTSDRSELFKLFHILFLLPPKINNSKRLE